MAVLGSCREFFPVIKRKFLHGGGWKEGKDMLIKGYFPHEDFLFDKEKNSWLSLEVSKSFTLRQRGDHHEEKNYI